MLPRTRNEQRAYVQRSWPNIAPNIYYVCKNQYNHNHYYYYYPSRVFFNVQFLMTKMSHLNHLSNLSITSNHLFEQKTKSLTGKENKHGQSANCSLSVIFIILGKWSIKNIQKHRNDSHASAYVHCYTWTGPVFVRHADSIINTNHAIRQSSNQWWIRWIGNS